MSSFNRYRLTELKTLVASLTICTAALFPTVSRAQMLDSLDRVMVDSALTLLKLTPAELGFDKLWAEDDTFRLAVVEKYLGDPMAFPGYVDETLLQVDSNYLKPRELLEFIDRQLVVNSSEKLAQPKVSLPEYDPADPFKVWKSALAAAEPYRRQFYARLDSLDLHDLIMAAPGLWSEGGDSVGRMLKGSWQTEFGLPVDTSRKADSDRLLDIIKKLDIHALIAAAEIVVPASQITSQGFAANGFNAAPLTEPIVGVTGTVLYYEETEWGRFIIGGDGENIYTGDFAAILDVGGDDIYRSRAGGAMGGLTHPYALVVDLKGDDYYDSGGKSVSQGAGFLGIGVLIDHDGNDSYRAGSYAQGAGLFGVGVLIDYAGDDDRRGGYFMQGAGHCGIGLLFDDGDNGDDRYLASTWAQGFAGTFGYGLLYDAGGDDNYRCGGVYLHEPLLPHDNQSFSGGFGMGWRPRAGGGIGVLYDNGTGVDYYDAEVMSFGSSYWYSIGILCDGGGNDRYSLAHYGLGAGIHLSLGAFYDRSGDDQYRSRMGVVGGTAHDLSVSVFVDGSGDDSYGTCDGWGVSLTNSFGLFIDRLGNDTYGVRPEGFSFGNVRWDRGFAGVGIFLDLEGDDVYPDNMPPADSSIWIQSGWGIGIDLPRDVVTEKEEPVPDPVLTAEDSAKSVEKLFEEASMWEVGNARETVARARKALLTKGGEAVRWAIANKLDTRDGLELRPLEDLLKAVPDTGGPLLIESLDTAGYWRVKANAAYLLGVMKWKPAVDPLLRQLDNDDAIKARNSIIGALGQIGETRTAEPIGKFLTDKEQRRRLAAIGALKTLKNPISIPPIIKRYADPEFTIRSATAVGLIEFGAPAAPLLTEYINETRNPNRELAVKSLGRIAAALKDSSGTEYAKLRFEAAQLFEDKMGDGDVQIRAASVEALYRMGGDETRRLIASRMENEFSPVVKAAYERVKRE
jgi:HEAT repeat protein